MCAQDAHICNVFVLQAKGPIRAPFCLWAAVCLCAERAAGPFSVCVYNSPSVHTLSFHSVSFSLFVYFYLTFCLFSYLLHVPVPLILQLSFFFTCSLARGIMQSYQKRIVSHACLCLHATLYSFQKLPFSSLWPAVITAAAASDALKLILLPTGSWKQILYYFTLSVYSLFLILYIPSSLTW